MGNGRINSNGRRGPRPPEDAKQGGRVTHCSRSRSRSLGKVSKASNRGAPRDGNEQTGNDAVEEGARSAKITRARRGIKQDGDGAGKMLARKRGNGKATKVEGGWPGRAWGMRCFASSTFGGKSLALARGSLYTRLHTDHTDMWMGTPSHNLLMSRLSLSSICLSTHTLYD
jgi:hypothetical protein